MNVKLPKLNWFFQQTGDKEITNIFTGSMGTDPEKGCINQTTLNYKVFPEKVEDTYTLAVETNIQLPFIKGSDKVSKEKRTFEFSEDGLDKAEEYIIIKSDALKEM